MSNKRFKSKTPEEDIDVDSGSDMEEEVNPIAEALQDLVDFFEAKLKSHDITSHSIVAEIGKFKASLEKKIEKAKAGVVPPPPTPLAPPPLVRQNGKEEKAYKPPSALSLNRTVSAALPTGGGAAAAGPPPHSSQ